MGDISLIRVPKPPALRRCARKISDNDREVKLPYCGNMYRLDEKDRRLILALKKNCRASLVALGRDIGLSRSATHDRITRLEELGVIIGYTVIIDENTAPMTRAFLTIKLEAGFESSVTTNVISEKAGVRSTYCLSGDIDLIAYCECTDIASLGMLRDEISLIKGVAEIHTRNVFSSSSN